MDVPSLPLRRSLGTFSNLLVIAVAMLFLYFGGLGPAVRIYRHNPRSIVARVIEFVYLPLEVASRPIGPLRDALERYVDLWVDDKDK